MNILPCSSIDITCLIGAMFLNEQCEDFYCVGIKFSLDDCKIMIELSDTPGGKVFSAVSFDQLNNWSIQF